MADSSVHPDAVTYHVIQHDEILFTLFATFHAVLHLVVARFVMAVDILSDAEEVPLRGSQLTCVKFVRMLISTVRQGIYFFGRHIGEVEAQERSDFFFGDALFPEMFEPVLNGSIIGRAQKSGVLEIVCHQLRDYAFDKHKRVDDTPYGGGMGMLMKAEPIALCFEDICKQIGKRPHFVYMSPQGKTLKQQRLRELADVENICILCGHYEGVDQRLLDEFIDEEISIGDYVLTGGEIPAMVFADALSRMVPGVLSNNECFTEESHFNGLLEYPQYTKPSVWRGKEVPKVLMSGHHANIEKWRKEKSIEVTALKRPEMLEEYNEK